jgi:hypothetical protein
MIASVVGKGQRNREDIQVYEMLRFGQKGQVQRLSEDLCPTSSDRKVMNFSAISACVASPLNIVVRSLSRPISVCISFTPRACIEGTANESKSIKKSAIFLSIIKKG